MKRLKINLFGEFFRLAKLGNLPDGLEGQSEELNEQLADWSISSDWNPDLKVIHEGLLDTYQNRIEIWYGGKKVRKLAMSELDYRFVMFPLFSVSNLQVDFDVGLEDVYFEESEVGLSGSYEAEIDTFEPADLSFDLLALNYRGRHIRLISGLRYLGRDLNVKRRDTVVTRRYFFRL